MMTSLPSRFAKIDIDILLEVSGHTFGNRLACLARKPAPVQAHWLGYPFTTGLDAIDYLIMDPVAVRQQDEAAFAETIVRLPGGRFCFQPPSYAPPVVGAPALRRGWVTFGSFNNLSKLTDQVLDAWAELMARVPVSRLVLKAVALDDVKAADRLRARAWSRAASAPSASSFAAARATRIRCASTAISISLWTRSRSVVARRAAMRSGWACLSCRCPIGNPCRARRQAFSMRWAAGMGCRRHRRLHRHCSAPGRQSFAAPGFALDAARRDAVVAALRSMRLGREMEAAMRWMWQRYLERSPIPASRRPAWPIDIRPRFLACPPADLAPNHWQRRRASSAMGDAARRRAGRQDGARSAQCRGKLSTPLRPRELLTTIVPSWAKIEVWVPRPPRSNPAGCSPRP